MTPGEAPRPGEPSADQDLHRSWVRAASQGDAASVSRLMDRHLPGLLAFVRARVGAALAAREDAQDLAQSACRELLEELQLRDYGDEADFKRWLYRAAENKIRDRARYHVRDKRDAGRLRPIADVPEREFATLARGMRDLFTPSRQAVAREELATLEGAMAQLPSDYAEVILLTRVVGLDRPRVAKEMERSESAIANLLHRALARLERLMREG